MSNVPDGEIWSRGESLQTTSKTILSPQFTLDQIYFKSDSSGQQARCKWGLDRCRNNVLEKWEIWFPDRRNTAPELSLQRKVIVAEVGQEEETVHCRRRCHRPSPVMKPYLEQASKICNWTAQVFVSKREKCICLRLFWYFSSSSRVRMCLISITNLTSNNNATYLAVEQFDNFPFWYSRAVLICRNYRLCTFSFVETSFIIRRKLSW